MKNWLYKQSTLVKVLLLLIPFINWIVELALRWTEFKKKGEVIRLVAAILAIPFGIVMGWIDLVCILLTNKVALDK